MTQTISQVDLDKYLSGATYPADKQKIIQFAKSKGAPSETVSALNGLPNKEYMDSADVSKEVTA